MGVVSGTAMDLVLTRRLQIGDPGGHCTKAMEAFPIPEVAERIWERYFVKGGKPSSAPFKSKPVLTLKPSQALLDLLVVGNFVEVWLAKQGHSNPVGINLLTKIQLPTVPSLFGAMMAGVDYVIMGAGIPRAIPGVLDSLAAGKETELEIDVTGAPAGVRTVSAFDPCHYLKHLSGNVKRPNFLGIISSTVLATMLAKRCDPPVDGFVIEGWTAGGHNAPPRDNSVFNDRGEPVYGEKDTPDLAKINDIGLPFWLAGSYATPDKLSEALATGAKGIQVGTAFAFCEESGMDPAIKERVLNQVRAKTIGVYTDAKASPTGFPFKVVEDNLTTFNEDVYQRRTRICDLGYLREAYYQDDGKVGYRCASEPIDDYERKGGDLEETVGRKCVCNGLLSTIGLGQVQKSGWHEPEIITAGDDLVNLGRFLKPDSNSYSANDVLDAILAPVPAPV